MKLILLQTAGVLHFGILIASALTPRVLNWRGTLAPLPALVRQLFWVYGAFIVLVIVSFGTLTLTFATELAEGAPLARGVCVFIAVFWLARLGVQWLVFDASPYLTAWWLRWGYHGLTVVFLFLASVYALSALRPGEVPL
jgi:hypothetical protein